MYMETVRDKEQPLIAEVLPHLEVGHFDVLADILQTAHDTDLATLLESLPLDQRRQVWELLHGQQQGDVLVHLHDEVRNSLIESMPHQALVDAVEHLDAEEIASVLEDVSEAKSDAILEQLDHETRAEVEASLSYPEDTAGRLMRFDAIEIRPDIDLYTVLRYLRLHKQLPDHTDGLMVVDEEKRYIGKLTLADIVTHMGNVKVSDVMFPHADVVSVHISHDELAHLFDRRDLVSVAVVNDEGKLIGRVTVDDILDVVRAQSERAMMNMAGLDEETDIFAPVMKSAKKRALWLGLNLATASIAAWVISQFEASIAQIVALAILMPIVASMGGVAGSQTLTLTVRGLALGQISLSNMRWLLKRQLAIGALNGLLWALVMGLAASLLFNLGIGIVIATALMINLIIAAGSGVIIPIVLDRMGVDPALSASMILMTITDVMGFLTFLGLATMFLL
jgi:magnesium transporter